MAANQPVDRRAQVKVVQDGGSERREEIHEDLVAEHEQQLFRVAQFVWLITGIVESVIGLRVLLKLMGANPQNAFASFIYNLSTIFVRPFGGLIPSPSAEGFVLELYAFIAMIVYALIAWAVVRLVWLIFYHPSARSVTHYERNRG